MSEEQKKLLFDEYVKMFGDDADYESFSAYVDQEFRYWLLNNILFMSVDLYFKYLKK